MYKFKFSFCAKVYINKSIILKVEEKGLELTLCYKCDCKPYFYSF